VTYKDSAKFRLSEYNENLILIVEQKEFIQPERKTKIFLDFPEAQPILATSNGSASRVECQTKTHFFA
jgi:hypothetical protein